MCAVGKGIKTGASMKCQPLMEASTHKYSKQNISVGATSDVLV
jgi:hypothetical protein